MSMFANAIKEESRRTYTENGCEAYSTTFNKCLDLFGCIGSFRGREDSEVERLFADAFNEDATLATKILFYARDIRGGCGERKVFRTLIKYLAKYHKNALIPNLDLIGVYGRYDDLYELIGTPVEDEMWAAMKKQFNEDVENLNADNAVSLLAKWIKTPDASSRSTRQLGILTAKKLGYTVYDFKRILRKLRKRIGVVETLMSNGEWDKIKYSAVPSRAMMIYRKAFDRHDGVRFGEFINNVLEGKEKINSSTLYPYDIVEKYLNGWSGVCRPQNEDALEAQWRQMPDYVEKGTNAIVVADVSGSMSGRPMATSIGLAMYFAEHNVGDFHNLFMTFSDRSDIIQLSGETLYQKIQFLSRADWNNSTNIEAAFERVLKLGIDNHIPQSEMVKSIIIISDMEFNSCTGGYYNRRGADWSFYDKMKSKFAEYGYEIPNIVFWNVNSRHDIFHADATRQGVQLCSGQSASTFKQLMGCIGMTPVEMMMKVINSDRYAAITVD